MEIKEILAMWKEYQKWLNEQGINSSNIKEKLPIFVNEIKNDPGKLNQLKSILSNQNVLNTAKQFNIGENEINQIKNIFESGSNMPKTGNLTKEQLDLIKKFKR